MFDLRKFVLDIVEKNNNNLENDFKVTLNNALDFLEKIGCIISAENALKIFNGNTNIFNFQNKSCLYIEDNEIKFLSDTFEINFTTNTYVYKFADSHMGFIVLEDNVMKYYYGNTLKKIVTNNYSLRILSNLDKINDSFVMANLEEKYDTYNVSPLEITKSIEEFANKILNSNVDYYKNEIDIESFLITQYKYIYGKEPNNIYKENIKNVIKYFDLSGIYIDLQKIDHCILNFDDQIELSEIVDEDIEDNDGLLTILEDELIYSNEELGKYINFTTGEIRIENSYLDSRDDLIYLAPNSEMIKYYGEKNYQEIIKYFDELLGYETFLSSLDIKNENLENILKRFLPNGIWSISNNFSILDKIKIVLKCKEDVLGIDDRITDGVEDLNALKLNYEEMLIHKCNLLMKNDSIKFNGDYKSAVNMLCTVLNHFSLTLDDEKLLDDGMNNLFDVYKNGSYYGYLVLREDFIGFKNNNFTINCLTGELRYYNGQVFMLKERYNDCLNQPLINLNIYNQESVSYLKAFLEVDDLLSDRINVQDFNKLSFIKPDESAFIETTISTINYIDEYINKSKDIDKALKMKGK